MVHSIKLLIRNLLYVILICAFLLVGTPTLGQSQNLTDEEALRDLIKTTFTYEPVILSLEIIDNFAFGGILQTYQGQALSGESQYYIAIWDGKVWNVNFEGTKVFRQLLSQVPEGLINPELKEYLDFETISGENQTITRASEYKLPWPGGVSHYITRAWASGTCSHGSTNAIDVQMSLNSTIVAARTGVVQTVKQSSTACGCNIDSNLGNWIIIKHVPDDGLYDWYVHIAKDGALVSQGDTVYQGQSIAKSHQIGNTCSTSGLYSCASGTCVAASGDCRPFPHLHFEVRNSAGSTVKITFLDAGDVVGCNTYTSGNYFDTTPPVSSISLSGTMGSNGWYKSNVTATISATDTISGVNYSQYNLNSAGWVNYSSPLVVSRNGTNILQYRSVDKVGNIESTKSTTFKIDTVAPTNPNSVTPSCTAQNNIWQNTCNDPSFSWSGASDTTSLVASYQYYWGTSPSGTDTTTTTSSLYDPPPISSDGTYYLRLRTQDNAGNWSSWVTLFTLRYDATAPTGSINLQKGWDTTAQTMISIQTEATDNIGNLSQMRLRDSGDSWSDWVPYQDTSLWLLPPINDQENTVEIEYVDAAGNISQTYSDSIFLNIYPSHPSSANFQLVKSTFGIGSTNAHSSSFSLKGTLSQVSATGYSESNNYQLTSGFWSWFYQVSDFFMNFLPFIMN